MSIRMEHFFLQIFCGTEPFPELYRAKKYKFNDNFFSKKDFRHIMMNLPVEVRLHLQFR